MRENIVKSDIPNSRKSPDIGQNSNGVISISGFWVHWRKLTTENCHKSRTSNDIERKLGPVTKLDKGNKGTSQNDYDVMSENCEIIEENWKLKIVINPEPVVILKGNLDQ